MQAPSTSLLRAFLQPSFCANCQRRTVTNYVNPKKYHKLNALDKLHRRQKQATRQELLDTHARADAMTFSPSPAQDAATSSTEQEASSSPLMTTSSNLLNSQLPSPSSLPYVINRTITKSIPVYHDTKNGGNKHLTVVRKLSGDLHALQRDIREALGLDQYTVDQQGRKKENVAINWTTRQIVVRGWRGPEIKKWAELRGF